MTAIACFEALLTAQVFISRSDKESILAGFG
jgi:hypothetical protein